MHPKFEGNVMLKEDTYKKICPVEI